MSSPPLLSPSKPNVELFLYLAVTFTIVSSALIREEERVQMPVYYTSKSLRGAEKRYPPIEKMALTLVTDACKLGPYFQAHTIIVLTNRPLKKALNSLNAAGRMVLWAIELSEFDVQYRPRTAIKAQALADFVAEFTPTKDEEGVEWGAAPWVISIESSFNKHVGGADVILKSPEGDVI